MLTEEQQKTPVEGLNGGDAVIMLQVINRLVATGRLQDTELLPIGKTRDSLIGSLQRATGVHFDRAREALLRQQQQAEAAAQQEAFAKQQAVAVPTQEAA